MADSAGGYRGQTPYPWLYIDSIQFRHINGVNIGFADGHARWFPKDSKYGDLFGADGQASVDDNVWFEPNSNPPAAAPNDARSDPRHDPGQNPRYDPRYDLRAGHRRRARRDRDHPAVGKRGRPCACRAGRNAAAGAAGAAAAAGGRASARSLSTAARAFRHGARAGEAPRRCARSGSGAGAPSAAARCACATTSGTAANGSSPRAHCSRRMTSFSVVRIIAAPADRAAWARLGLGEDRDDAPGVFLGRIAGERKTGAPERIAHAVGAIRDGAGAKRQAGVSRRLSQAPLPYPGGRLLRVAKN